MRQGLQKRTVGKMMSNAVFFKDKIYLDYKERVAAYVRNRIADHYAAEDVVSEVFQKVFQKLESYNESRASLSTWIYTITRNTVIDYYKKNKTQSLSVDEVAAAEDIPDETTAQDEILEELANALEKLSKRERDIIILHYYKGYTLKRIAEMTGISYINAKVTHTKALSLLRNLLNWNCQSY